MKQTDNEKGQLMEGATKRTRVWGETAETENLSNQQVIQLQNDKMKMQDEKLDIISKSISRQKELAKAIGDETEIHLQILDEVDTKIENTTRNVTRGIFIFIDKDFINLF